MANNKDAFSKHKVHQVKDCVATRSIFRDCSRTEFLNCNARYEEHTITHYPIGAGASVLVLDVVLAQRGPITEPPVAIPKLMCTAWLWDTTRTWPSVWVQLARLGLGLRHPVLGVLP